MDTCTDFTKSCNFCGSNLVFEKLGISHSKDDIFMFNGTLPFSPIIPSRNSNPNRSYTKDTGDNERDISHQDLINAMSMYVQNEVANSSKTQESDSQNPTKLFEEDENEEKKFENSEKEVFMKSQNSPNKNQNRIFSNYEESEFDVEKHKHPKNSDSSTNKSEFENMYNYSSEKISELIWKNDKKLKIFNPKLDPGIFGDDDKNDSLLSERRLTEQYDFEIEYTKKEKDMLDYEFLITTLSNSGFSFSLSKYILEHIVSSEQYSDLLKIVNSSSFSIEEKVKNILDNIRNIVEVKELEEM